MKITTCNPQIITKNAESSVQLFEELGFEKRHTQNNIGEMNVSAIRMKDANGFYLDISQPDGMPIPHDLVAIRLNVDDFAKACELLTSHGFKKYLGDRTTRTSSSESAMMVSPGGLAINLIQHIK